MRILFSVLFATLFFILGTGGSVTAQYKTKLDSISTGNNQIPDTFNPANVTLLIEETADQDSSGVSNSVTVTYRTDEYINAFVGRNKKKMVSYLDENYSSKYEFAAQSEIYGATEKYSDKTVYRYALVISLLKPEQRVKTQFYSGKEESTHYQPVFRYYVYDRLNNKTYAALGHGSSIIMMAFKSAIKKIKEGK
jgi:hypothetical protein